MSQTPAQAEAPPSPNEIRAAAPERPRVAPQKPRKVLVFSLPKGFVHPSIPYGEKALQLLGEKSGAFTTVATRDPEFFRPERLQEFDAVIMNNISGEVFTDPALRESLAKFVSEGKGLVGIHGATTALREWPEYGQMIGAYFNTHPWNSRTTVTLKIEEPEHPLCAAFPETSLTLVEEIYQFKAPYSRSRLRVLVSLDTEKTDMSLRGIDRFDHDFPVSWVRTHGKGRVFYSSLGHNFHIYANPVILQHFLDGIQYALGDLPALAEPNPEAAQKILAAALPEKLKFLRSYSYGAENQVLTDLDSLVKEAVYYPALRKDFTGKFGKLLQETIAASDTSATMVRTQYLCRKLAELGAEEAVPFLAPLLKHSDIRVAEAARLALQNIPVEAAVTSLREALADAPAANCPGIALALGERRDQQAVKALAPMARTKDSPEIAQAAIIALGAIGSTKAAAALEEAEADAPDTLKPALIQARLECAGLLAKGGQTEEARRSYAGVLEHAKAEADRAAAFLGLAGIAGPEGRALVIGELLGKDASLREAAVAFLRQDRTPELGEDLVRALDGAPAEVQVIGLGILAERQEKAALEFARKQAAADDEAIRVAALQALGAVGDRSTVELLASAAAGKKGAEREASRGSLARINADGADDAILDLLRKQRGVSSPEAAAMRYELVAALEERHTTEGVAELLQAASDPESRVRQKVFEALAKLAGANEAQALVALLPKASPESVRKEAEKAVVAACRKIDEESAREDAVAAALAAAKESDLAASFVRVLGRIGTPEALAVLREKLKGVAEADAQVRDALVRAIVEFPTAEALADTMQFARTSNEEVLQTLAVRGAARMLALPVQRPAEESLRFWTELMNLAHRAEEQKLILGQLAGTAEPALLPFVLKKLENADLKDEAIAAAIKLADSAVKTAPDASREALNVIVEKADPAGRKKAEAILKKLEAPKR